VRESNLLSVNKRKAPSIKVIDLSGQPQRYHISQVKWNIQSAEKEGYAHFMLKEIEEQPEDLGDRMFLSITQRNAPEGGHMD